MLRGAANILREGIVGIDDNAFTTQRLRTIANIRVVSFLLFVPAMAFAYFSHLGTAHQPHAAQLVVGLWLGLWFMHLFLSIFFVFHLKGKTETVSPTFYSLNMLCIVFELGTNQLSSYLIGTIPGNSVLTPIVLVAVYRVFIDHRVVVFILGVSMFFYWSVGLAELSGQIHIAPFLPDPFVHPINGSVSDAVTYLSINTIFLLLVFWCVNISVNQRNFLHRYITETVLARHLPASMVERASRGELRMDAEPEKHVCTIVFTDLVGFTQLSEKLGAEGIGKILNRCLSDLTDIAHRHEATVDKFIGDCSMFVFGVPEHLDPKEQAKRAVALAKEIHREIPMRYQDHKLRARTGINTGEVVAGNFGSERRSDYTVIGPAVNIAARLESKSKDGRILIGPTTAELLENSVTLETIGKIKLKGVSEPIEAYFVAED